VATANGHGKAQELIAMLFWQIYVCGAFVAAAAVSVAADLVSDRDAPPTHRALAIVAAAMLWPVLLVGVLELLGIAGISKALSARPSEPARSAVSP
jgi:hypothetical protein